MRFVSLEILNCRNLRGVRVDLGPGINYFFGENGAGKTAVLEAVSVLSRGRSFRTSSPGQLISFGEDVLTVRASVLDEHRGRQTVGMSRSRSGKIELRLNGEAGRRMSDVARLLPVQMLLPSLSDLVFGGPLERRQWLDWGLFHVEPGYLGALRGYLQVLRQRNAALKSVAGGRLTGEDLGVWTEKLAERANAIDRWRQAYVDQAGCEIQGLLASLAPTLEISFRYRRGWPEKESLEKVLSDSLSRDVKSGSTSAGPHRSDIEMRAGGDDGPRAAAVLSRGQGKLLASAMLLGQAKMLNLVASRKSVFLIDDLGAELDREHNVKLFQVLGAMGCQVLATSTQAPDWLESATVEPVSLFHVEHGRVSFLGNSRTKLRSDNAQ